MTLRRRDPITHERLLQLLSYEPETGVFRWRVTEGWWAVAGEPVGTLWNGYLKVVLDQRPYRLHRLAWFYVTGLWPTDMIDHIDQCRTNNRFANLREADMAANQQNRNAPSRLNRSGLLGVSGKPCGRFYSRIRVDNQVIYLGTFPTAEEAHQAYLAAKRVLHPTCSFPPTSSEINTARDAALKERS